MKKVVGDKITTKQELLRALVLEISQSRNQRQPNDFTAQEFVDFYEAETGVHLSRDMAYKELKARGYQKFRISSHDFVWRKKEA